MELEVILKKDNIPVFDPCAIAVKYIEFGCIYCGNDITEDVISQILKQIPSGIQAVVYLDPIGEDNWMEVLCDGEWLALVFSGDFGENNYYSYNLTFAGVTEITPLLSGGQSPIEK